MQKSLTQRQWYDLIEQWESSSDSQPAFCKRHDLNYTTFGYWRNKYLVQSRRTKTSAFSSIEVEKEKPFPEIVLTLPCKASIQLKHSDKSTLRLVLEVLGELGC